MTLADERWVLVDTETFGLNPQTDFVIEVGFLICTLDFEVVTHAEFLIWELGYHDVWHSRLQAQAERAIDEKVRQDAQFILNMHTKSGLFDDARTQGVGIAQAREDMLEWLTLNQVTDSLDMSDRDPMVGSTIDFDRGMLRAQYPEVDNQFSYRSVNISSLKEMCRRYSPSIYEGLGRTVKSRKLHRVEPDCIDSMEELRFYVDNFIWTE